MIDETQDLLIPATWAGEKVWKKLATSWLYICRDLSVTGLEEIKHFIRERSSSYVAICTEQAVSGASTTIMFIVFKSACSESTIKTKHKLRHGTLLAKKPGYPAPSDVVEWMRGPCKIDEMMKPYNPSFVEMRKERYLMKRREHEKEFLDSSSHFSMFDGSVPVIEVTDDPSSFSEPVKVVETKPIPSRPVPYMPVPPPNCWISPLSPSAPISPIYSIVASSSTGGRSKEIPTIPKSVSFRAPSTSSR